VKTSAFIIFFTIVLVIYGAVNSYIFIRGLQALPSGSGYRIYYITGFWFLAGTFVLARIMERVYPCQVTEIITWIGSFWLAFLLYLVLICLFLDLARFIGYFLHINPAFVYSDYQHTKMVLLFSAVLCVAIVVTGGFINARSPRITKLELKINKTVQGEKSLKIVMASDIHLGTIIARRKASRLVASINNLQPDLVLFAGDVVDEDLAPVINNNLGDNLKRIKARLGVYAITGNHEYIGGAEAAVRYLNSHGVTVLRDTSILIDGKFYLVGREDRDRSRFTGKQRVEISELFKEVDRKYPVILMDHQPFNLENAVNAGVDLQLSGHTHHGQLWPFNYITKAMYEISSGYKQIGHTHFYVSTGFGTWGPPVRIGNRPEIVEIILNFN